jgi:hypothetical protein
MADEDTQMASTEPLDEPGDTDETTPTPEAVARLATRQVTLDRITLLGIFGTDSAPAALVRGANGQTTRVGLGDSIAGGTVIAIGADQLVLSRATGQKVLRLPQG